MAYRFAGRQKLISLCSYPSVSLREAREKREDAKKTAERTYRSQRSTAAGQRSGGGSGP
ncbi:Arm DNA-binding domain-containing protein [Desulfovibrio sp. SGI.169]|uniref:Arm DNA-binding domain-containing protein n=1 Tax=Desulfovibrio sp. SGI.169 TaxID=3420561 RepID=UPI003D0433E0